MQKQIPKLGKTIEVKVPSEPVEELLTNLMSQSTWKGLFDRAFWKKLSFSFGEATFPALGLLCGERFWSEARHVLRTSVSDIFCPACHLPLDLPLSGEMGQWAAASSSLLARLPMQTFVKKQMLLTFKSNFSSGRIRKRTVSE